MTRQIGRVLDFNRKLLLSVIGTAVLALPILLGFTHMVRAQAQAGGDYPDEKPHVAFSVASVKKLPKLTLSVQNITPGSFYYISSLKPIVKLAYEVEYYQIADTPLLSHYMEQYEIQAKLPEGSEISDIPAMLRSLLAERFHFKAHWEQQSTPVYLLLADAEDMDLTPHPVNPDITELEKPIKWGASTGQWGFDGPATLGDLALELGKAMDRPVLDRTNIEGVFDITIYAHIPPKQINLPRPAFLDRKDESTNNTGPRSDFILPNGEVMGGIAPPIDKVLQKMGLRMEKSKEPIRVLVVDDVSREPIPN